MNPQLANLLRLLLAMLGARLATKGWIEPGAETQFADYLLAITGAGISLGSLVSAARATRKTAGVVNTALALPAHSTAFDLKSVRPAFGGGFQDYVIRQAISTVMMILSDNLRTKKFERYLEPLRDELNAALPAK